MSIAILSFGSNLGNKLQHIRNSILDIKSDEKIKILRYSNICETEPIGVVGQNNFYNCVITIKTEYTSGELLQFLQSVEIKNGRTREYKWSPRNIDIDIIDFDRTILESEILTLPHPRMHERKFVLLPMKEVYPDYIHPKFNIDIDTMIDKITGQYCYNLNLENWYHE